MNQRILQLLFRAAGQLDKLCLWPKKEREGQNSVGGRRRKIGNGLDFISTSRLNRKRKLPDADGFASSLPTNRHDSPPPPAVSNYYKVIRTSWGGMVLAWGRRTYQYL